MNYRILTHKKIGKVHNLYLDINMNKTDYLIETSFYAESDYYLGDSFKFNDNPMMEKLCPVIDKLFSTGDCVYCVIDLINNTIVITDVHKANFDSLIVFNNFSKNPENTLETQENVLFGTAITINDQEKEYADILIGGCIVLEDVMSVDGVGPLCMTIQILIDGNVDFTYNIDCTRKHEILNFDHTFKNIKTNKNTNIIIRYSYDYYKYGSSYVSPTIKNNNVTIYIEGSNIMTSDANLFKYYLTTSNDGETYAVINGVIDCNRIAYRFPNVCIDTDGNSYPVKEVIVGSLNLPNVKFISFASGIEYLDLYGLRPYGYKYGDDLFYTTNYTVENTIKDDYVIVSFPDKVTYINKDNTNSGPLFNKEKEFIIHGNPDKTLTFSSSTFPILSILPSGEYPTITIDNFKTIYFNSYYNNNFSKANVINLEGYFVSYINYSSIKYYNSNNPYGLIRLTTTEDNWMIMEPSNNVSINIKSTFCSLYQAIYYLYVYMHRCDIETAEKFHFKSDADDVFYYIHHTMININAKSDIIHYWDGGSLSNKKCFLSEYYKPVQIYYSSSDEKYVIENIFSYSKTSSLIYGENTNGAKYMTIDGAMHNTVCHINVNVTGNVYSYPEIRTYYSLNNKVVINGNLYSQPYCNYSKYSSIFDNYYKSYMYMYYYKNAYDSCIVNGTYDLSKNIYGITVKVVSRSRWSYDENGNSIPTGYYTVSLTEDRYFGIDNNSITTNKISLSSIPSRGYGFKKFHADTLEGIVAIPCKYTTNGYTSYTIPSIDGKHSNATLYTSSMCEFSFKEIKPDTIITNFGNQNLAKIDIDFSNLAGIGDLSFCNLTKLKLPNPIVVILKAPNYTNMSRSIYYSKSVTNSNYEYYYDDTEDFLWDPTWISSEELYSYVQYNIEIDFNAMVLGDIYLKFVPLTQEELETDIYATTIFRNNSRLKESAMEIEERLSSLTEEERINDDSTYEYYEISKIRKPILPKNSDIAEGIENFEFNYNSTFSFCCYCKIDNSTGEFTVYPKIRLFDVTRYIGSNFLDGSAYILNQDPDVFELPKQLKYYGSKAFNFTFYESYYDESNSRYDYKSYKGGWASAYYTDQNQLKTLRRYLKEVKIGKYLETMEGNVFPFADKCTIDPENHNFVIEDGYIFNKDKTILYRPVCYSEFSEYTNNSDEYVFKSSSLKKIVDRTSFKYDDRIIGIEITSGKLELSEYTNILEMPDNCTSIILPSGEYTIRDEDFEKMEYIEFQNITANSKYYNIPGSLANDIYSNYNTTITAYADYIKYTNNTQVNKFTFDISGSRMIFAKKNMTVSLPDICTELGGRIDIDTLKLTNTRDSQFNINSPNLRIHNYAIEDGNENFSVRTSNGKSVLWYNTIVVDHSMSSNKKQVLYKYPNGDDSDIIDITLDNSEQIDSIAFKYCDIKEITIHSPERTNNVFSVAGTEERVSPVTVFNAFDSEAYVNPKQHTYYDNKDINNITQCATASSSYPSTQCYYKFAQPYYYRYTDHNILALPIRNDVIESLTIDFDPKYLFGEFYNSESVGRAVFYGEQNRFTSKLSGTVVGYYLYSYGTYIINSFILPPINKMYINYNFGTDMKCKFPILPLYDEVYFDESNLDTIKSINKLVVCNPNAKIYPESLLTKIDNIHNYELYYHTNTNLYLTQTEYVDCVFGEKCGAPFPSDSTITLDNCFLHSLFIHPSCKNINLIIQDNCRFGYCTDITVLGITTPNIYNQYADYLRTTNTSYYTTGNDLGDEKRMFFLLSPREALLDTSGYSYMEKICSIFSSITSPRLFSFQYSGILAYDDKYKLGGLYKITQDILYIPRYCFDVTSTTYNDTDYATGYAMFEYSQFKDIVSKLKNICEDNRFLVPTNPDGDTVYEFSSSFQMWEDCFCSNKQEYIDEWIINGDIMRHRGDSTRYHTKFTGGTTLQYFVKKFTFKTPEVYFYFSGGLLYIMKRDYPNYNPTQHHVLNIVSDNAIIDIGDMPYDKMLGNTWYPDDLVSTEYGQQSYEIIFDSNITNVSINQLQVPNMYSEILDFSAYPDINFTLGTSDPMTPYSDYYDYWYMNIVKLSGFKKIVMSENVSMYGNLVPCPFYYSIVETIEFKSGQLYSVRRCEYTTTLIFADTYTDIDQVYDSYNKDTICNVNLDNIQTISRFITNESYEGFSNYGHGTFISCDLSNTNLTSLISIENLAGFSGCKFVEELDCPELVSIGDYGFEYTRQTKTINLPKCTHIGEYAFTYSKDLTTLNAPILTSISAYAFVSSSLSTLNTPLLTTIETHAFDTCDFSGVLILESVESIDSYAFHNNPNITEVHLPKCKSIGANAFYSCINIRKAFLHPDCVIEATSFYNATEIDRVKYS